MQERKQKHVSESLSCLYFASILRLIGSFAHLPCLRELFFLPRATLPVLVYFPSMRQRDRKRVAVLNPDPLSSALGGPVLPLVCRFIRRDNLLLWRELFTNLNELKSRI